MNLLHEGRTPVFLRTLYKKESTRKFKVGVGLFKLVGKDTNQLHRLQMYDGRAAADATPFGKAEE